MAIPKRRVDRRPQRTRQVLQQAFKDVVLEKGFAATSIQDITERANVNRGTFYLHFADKYMLVDTVIREQFHQLLAQALPPAPRWDRRSVELLIRAVLDCFESKYRHQRPRLPVPVPLLEQAIHEELTELLCAWIRQAQCATHGRVPPATVARVVSWAIFGAAVQWSQEAITISAEQMAGDILLVIMEGAAGLVPEVSG